jgi:hypothetical protein
MVTVLTQMLPSELEARFQRSPASRLDASGLLRSKVPFRELVKALPIHDFFVKNGICGGRPHGARHVSRASEDAERI